MPVVLVNGQPRELPPGTTVADLLKLLNAADRPVAVEVNLDLVPRACHAQRRLQEGDRVEVVALAGGG
ncbi:MAG: sulfur carrier protein ThiS [Pirellulales bacterium]|jgi:sulfur carrier protein|nr:sulfur carrier protein ThiS [Pirellulales bacterium]